MVVGKHALRVTQVELPQLLDCDCLPLSTQHIAFSSSLFSVQLGQNCPRPSWQLRQIRSESTIKQSEARSPGLSQQRRYMRLLASAVRRRSQTSHAEPAGANVGFHNYSGAGGFLTQGLDAAQTCPAAVRQMQAGREVHWAGVASDCGFYDQAHLANEFWAFRGLTSPVRVRSKHDLRANHARNN